MCLKKKTKDSSEQLENNRSLSFVWIFIILNQTSAKELDGRRHPRGRGYKTHTILSSGDMDYEPTKGESCSQCYLRVHLEFDNIVAVGTNVNKRSK